LRGSRAGILAARFTFDAMSDPPPRLALSLVVVAHDAGAQLADCLTSAAFAAEVIVVDSGSRDDTVELARRSGARVITQPWLGFGRQKNFAVAQAAHDWVLCLDADERVSPELERAATGFSAAGSRTAKATPIGTCGFSTAATHAGATTSCTSTCSPTDR
jgi:glycosyltransferase involved in cell wall biosynthesis